MTYELEFSEKAWKEWQKLGSTLREQFKKKLQEQNHTKKTVGAAVRRSNLPAITP